MPDTALAPPADAEFAESAFTTAPLCFANVFSERECDEILALSQPHLKYRCGLSEPREGVRTALTAWLEASPQVQPIVDRLTELVGKVNAHYRFDIRGYRDPLLVSTYGIEDHFDWHFDNCEAATSTRKLSISIQLSSPRDYEGGALEFSPGGELPFARARGSAILFPAYLCHRVSPVTRGSRTALIWWAHGPAFR